MKASLILISALCLGLSTTSCSNQGAEQALSSSEQGSLPQLEPSEIIPLDLSAERIAKEEAEYERFLSLDSIVQTHSVAVLGSKDFEFYTSKGELYKGYYSTESGCSWYCSGQLTASTESNEGLRSTSGTSLAHDFDLSTAELFDIDKGNKLTYYIAPNPSLTVTTLNIYNGYSKDDQLYTQYGRARQIKYYVDGQAKGILSLQDTPGLQRFRIETLSNTSREMVLAFEIIDNYAGKASQQVAIAEIELDGDGHH